MAAALPWSQAGYPTGYSPCPRHGAMIPTSPASLAPPPGEVYRPAIVMPEQDPRAAKEADLLLRAETPLERRRVRGITHQIIVDDDRCTMIIIFSRATQAGGVVEPRKFIEDPMLRAKKIFCVVGEPASEKSLEHLQFIKEGERCTMAEFQADIRARFLEILEASGINAEQFSSIDGDEDFLKIYLPEYGVAIKQMAETLQYSMPYKEEKYSGLKATGPYKGSEPLENDDGDRVVAFGTYTVDRDDNFQPFRFIDTLRILEAHLAQYVSLDAMERQGVILQYFPCPKAKDMEYLFLNECNPWRVFCPPTNENSTQFRDYFGQDICFFYRFYSFLIRSMVLLSMGGGVYYLIAVFASDAIKEHDGYLRTVFCVVLSIWATLLFQVWGRRETRICQLWGCEDAHRMEADRPDWDYLRSRKSLTVNALTLLYVAVYASAMEGILEWSKQLAAEGTDGTHAAIILSVVIKGGSFLWGKVAPLLVGYENLRTEIQYQQKLTTLLAGVKIFVALWPLVAQCFLSTYNDARCYPDLETAMNATWSITPAMLNNISFNETIHILRSSYMYDVVGRKLPICVRGCYPVLSHPDRDGLDPLHILGMERTSHEGLQPWTDTQCQSAAVLNLRTYFAIQIATELLFLVIGIALTKLEIHKEQSKVDEESSYSLLQYSAKCWKYEYNSWGGSLVEDYLDIGISYAVVVCFGIITPVMALLAMLAFMFSYRLRIYRSLYVAQRPRPRTSTGMGIWFGIFGYINTVAVICNGALSALFFYPSRNWSLAHQLLVFVVIEHFVLVLRQVVDFLVPDEPTDVEEIRHYNEYFKKCIESTDSVETLRNIDLSHLDLSLDPDNIGEDTEDEDTECSWS